MAAKKKAAPTETPELSELRELTTLPSRLIYLRDRMKATQASIAKAAGMDKGQLSRLENGHRVQGIEASTLIRLAKALGCPVGWLAADEGQPGPVPVFREGQDRRRKPDSGKSR
jgi:transcriptional regulator with XRE-family HTH domain